MLMSVDGLNMLISLEGGYKNQMYHDQSNLPTIGVGHLLTKDELMSGKIVISDAVSIPWGGELSLAEMDEIFTQDMADTTDIINGLVRVPLTQPQFDALASLAFNIGLKSFRFSTLLKKLNAGDYDSVPDQMRRWIYSKKVKLPVLILRRETEIARWKSSV